MKLLIGLLLLVIIGCNKPTTAEPEYITFSFVECPEGWEHVDHEVNGVRRVGCYPKDFDYEAANKRLAEHLKKED
ncbi:MAG: hypothetical protein ACYSR0_09525 [Planctomycetota bacterium]|jgi:hypothetical protein